MSSIPIGERRAIKVDAQLDEEYYRQPSEVVRC